MNVIEELRAVGVTAPPSPDTLDAVRVSILRAAPESATAPRYRRWLQHRVLTSVAAVALVGGGSVAVWAALTATVNPKTATTIECGVDTFIPVETGNPVLACYEALAHQGGTVPPLVGWVTPTGLVEVLPSGQRPLAGSTPLPSGFQVDAGVRYATDSLGDASGPLQSGCLSSPSAIDFTQGQLAIAGLASWHVRVDAPNGSTSCDAYTAVVEAQATTIVLESAPNGSPQGDAGNVTIRLDDELHAQLVSGPDAACLTTRAAEALASRDAASLGIPLDAVMISDAGMVGSGARCATPFVEPAGNVDVVLWQAPRT